MNKIVLKHIFRFFLFIGLQVLVLNNVFFWGYINPYGYILFLLLLPIGMSKSRVLILAFILGLTVDSFQNSFGIHAFACVLLGYYRLKLLEYLIPQLKNKKQDNLEFSIQEFGIQACLIYTSCMVFLHHFTIFSLEVFRLDVIGVLSRTISSGIVTTALLIILQFLLFRNIKR
jgi:rod shape-determining protein MreD